MSQGVQAAIETATARLAAAGDASRATQMAAYMKTEMPFFGVQSADRRVIARELAGDAAPSTPAEYSRLVLTLWTLPHREQKYLALDMADRFRAFRTVEAMPLYERLIVEGAWWDLVDTVVSRLVNPVLLADPEAWAWPDRWIESHDLWLRRSAIISQLKSKERTDVDRLARYCLAWLDEKEFFIRKAIGWALRQYARTDPDWVGAFVARHGDRMSGLSRREATKHL